MYGGGGISPDVFIPLDTIQTNEYFLQLRQHLLQFATRWLENNDPNKLPTDLNTFAQSWFAPPSMLEELVAYGEKQGIKRNPVQLAVCQNELKLQIKAQLAKSLFGLVGLYTVMNDDDPAVEKALHLLKTGARVAGK